MKDIFISYKSEDYNTAKWVREYLEKCGLSVWMAPEDIGGGENYASSIPSAIENCKVFVLILSELAQTSKWVPRELDQAINDDKVIMPYMIKKFELNKDFRFYLTNVQCYPAYDDMSGQLVEMTRRIMAVPGITVNKTEEKKAEVRSIQPEKPQNQPVQVKEPDFSGTGLLGEKQKLRYAVNTARKIYDNRESAPEEKIKAFEYLRWAARKNDPEACFLFGHYMLLGRIKIMEAPSDERGMFYMEKAARLGYKEAQQEMDAFCNFRYRMLVGDKIALQAPAPLRDYDGWKIKIKHAGRFMPVNAELVYKDGENILYIDVKVNTIVNDEEVVDREKFIEAVEEGFRSWEGVYTVFGGQKLIVIVDVHFHEYAVIGVINVASAKSDAMKAAIKLRGIYGQEEQSKLRDAANKSRSFASMGLKKWSMRNPKNIFINNPTGRFDNYEDIRQGIRNEFGYVLGLNDMGRIPRGTYPELDPYYIEDGRYNLVMSNGRGVISNNDIEMVILALSENEMQYYNEDDKGHKPSKALGKGN